MQNSVQGCTWIYEEEMQFDFTPKVQMTVILGTAHIIVLSDAVHMLMPLIIGKNRPLQLRFVFPTQTT